jgi:catechol 2,3-dioxygenase-like lactoylglutathione lyase family enzyme
MSTKPEIALRVADLAESTRFYSECLGFKAMQQDHPDLALLDLGEFSFLLAGPAAPDLTPYLSQPSFIFQPGETLYMPIRLLSFQSADFDSRRAELAARVASDVQVIEKPWGDRALEVRDPSGSPWRFWEEANLSQADKLALYERCPAELEALLAPLTTAELDLAQPRHWTIRQIVHHIADGDALWSGALKAALAKSGTAYSHEWYSGNDAMELALDYAHRPIEPALALFRAHRAYFSQVISHLPDAWERFVLFQHRDQAEDRVTVEVIVRSQATHALEHLEEIQDTLKARGG